MAHHYYTTRDIPAQGSAGGAVRVLGWFAPEADALAAARLRVCGLPVALNGFVDALAANQRELAAFGADDVTPNPGVLAPANGAYCLSHTAPQEDTMKGYGKGTGKSGMHKMPDGSMMKGAKHPGGKPKAKPAKGGRKK